ncbi:MAG: cation-translocating P-type ATPase [bacterium]|nr:cation-translocating P-type ATPase [bacterium]
MPNTNIVRTERYREMVVLSLVPVLVLALILASWALAHWQTGPVFVNAALALIAVLLGGIPRFISGVKDALRARITVNVFVTVALAVTVAVGEFRAAAVIIFIMAMVGALESYTLDKTRRAIRDLLHLAPPTATVRRGEGEVTVPVSELQAGDIVVVRPGERIPVDGVVTAGAGTVNQAPITGESMPVEKFMGSEVFSGTLNETGRLDVRTVKTGADTKLAQIVHLVEAAQETKAPIQTMADRFTVWFFPIVLALAILAFFTSGDIKVAVAVLLVACPCAFAIATPSAVSAGIANMARRSVLIKGGIYFELAGKIDILLVDKTGTLTLGRPKVVQVAGEDGFSAEIVLRLAAIAEKYSEHPLAKSVMALARERALDVPDPDDFKIEIGLGVTASHDGGSIAVGKEEFLRGRGITVSAHLAAEAAAQTERGHTTVLVAHGQQAVGLVAIADEVKPETAQAMAALKSLGVRHIIMLTGDNPRVARAVAEQIGMDDFRAGLLPEDKQRVVKELIDQGRTIAMVGDGINDAPALALAHVGIVMGAAGTDVAIEAADVTLMNDDLDRVVDFVQMSRKVLRRIRMNIFLSIIYNAIGLALGTLGLLTPVVAVIFQEAGCISVVLSSTLLLWARPQPWKSRQLPPRTAQVLAVSEPTVSQQS